MIKRALFSILLMVSVFTCIGLADSVQITHYRLKFKINRAFAVEENAKYALPAGEYQLRELDSFPDHLFSVERVSDRKHMATVTTVRIDRMHDNWHHPDKAVFDFENPELPVFKEFYVTGANGWEIIDAEYNKSAVLEVASLNVVKANITMTPMAVEAPAPAPEPVAEPAPEPEKAPVVEQPREEPKPEPVAPIQERTRVRKD